MRFLFWFLDGVGLGPAAPETNPLARAEMPVLQRLLGGRKLTAGAPPFEGPRATLLALDANLGVNGLPQSATGQAALLTGQNVPEAIGQHYGPKPNRAVARFLESGAIFAEALRAGLKVALLNAYPPRYFESIHSGRRLYSAIPLAVTQAGIPLRSSADLFNGQALSADLTGSGWREMLGIHDAPLITPGQAGARLAGLAQTFDFSFFEFWLTDYAGHRQDMQSAVDLLHILDAALDGLLQTLDEQECLVLITSDHGNLEDLSTRRHTLNPVPALLIGSLPARRLFSEGLRDLTGIAPAIRRLIFPNSASANL